MSDMTERFEMDDSMKALPPGKYRVRAIRSIEDGVIVTRLAIPVKQAQAGNDGIQTEAQRRYPPSMLIEDYDGDRYVDDEYGYDETARKAFIAGAEWQAEQSVAAALEALAPDDLQVVPVPKMQSTPEMRSLIRDNVDRGLHIRSSHVAAILNDLVAVQKRREFERRSAIRQWNEAIQEREAPAAVIDQAKAAMADPGGYFYEDVCKLVATTDTDAALREVRAKELQDFYDGLELPGTDATGYYSSEQQSGYNEAERHLDTRLHARITAIREGKS